VAPSWITTLFWSFEKSYFYDIFLWINVLKWFRWRLTQLWNIHIWWPSWFSPPFWSAIWSFLWSSLPKYIYIFLRSTLNLKAPKIGQNCVTYFMDGPFGVQQIETTFKHHIIELTLNWSNNLKKPYVGRKCDLYYFLTTKCAWNDPNIQKLPTLIFSQQHH
jgi:hypothetical protein